MSEPDDENEERQLGRVAGKVAFITGAARGMGRAHAVRLAEEGADIIAVDLCGKVDGVGYSSSTSDELDETARQVKDLGRKVFTAEADVRNQADIDSALEAGVQALGGPDIVVANAGIMAFGAAHDISEEAWQRTVDINLGGSWRTAKAAVPYMVSGGRGGSITFINSVAGLRGGPWLGHYASAKHGLIGLMQSMAGELGPHYIRVNCVHPTQVDTPMIQYQGLYKLFSPESEEPSREEFAAASETMHLIPVPWVDPRDVANAVAFLCSDEARYITGASLPVDAGAAIK